MHMCTTGLLKAARQRSKRLKAPSIFGGFAHLQPGDFSLYWWRTHWSTLVEIRSVGLYWWCAKSIEE